MTHRDENALMVNALQRCSDVVVQNSVQEGFGLTVTEAMWKATPVLGSNACGIRQQIQNGVDGLLLGDGKDPAAVARGLSEFLEAPERAEHLGRSARLRCHSEFLVLTQTERYLEVLINTLER